VLAAIVLAAYKKYLAAVLVLLIIPAKLQIEHVVKSEFLRERPKVYIDDAILRGDVQASGLSFASGHAMIIFAIATFMTPFVPKVVRIVVWTIAVLCIIARVYLGAHLPLDVLGGALLGVALGLLLLVLHRCIGRLLHKKK
jgi:undecaprenyl-diphosphatase